MRNSIVVVLVGYFLFGCAAVEMSGRMTRMTGEAMTDYANSHTGFFATGARIGGAINTAVGATVEGIAKKGDGSGSKGAQFIDANKKVTTAAVQAVKNDKPIITRAQKRLQALGYDIGTADGMIGPKTSAAIGHYQKEKGLQVTQALDTQTLDSLGVRP